MRLFNQNVQFYNQDVSRNRSPSTDPPDIQIRNIEVMLAAVVLMQGSMIQHILQPIGELCYLNRTVHRLRELLSPTIKNNHQPRTLQEAQLWCSFACASWELTYLPHSRGRWEPWFVQALRQKSLAMNVGTWEHASSIFERYWSSDQMAPRGTEWFDDLMAKGTVRPDIRGIYRDCCWQQYCSLAPRQRVVVPTIT